MSRHKRSRLFIDPAVQWSIIRRVLTHWTTFLVAGTLLSMFNGMMQSDGQDWTIVSLFQQQLPFILVSLLLLPVFLMDTIKLSHRFVGPMIRFRHAMKSLTQGEGKAGALTFRPGDFWNEIALDFNRFAGRINIARKQTTDPMESVESQLALNDSLWEPKRLMDDFDQQLDEIAPTTGAGSEHSPGEGNEEKRKTKYVDRLVQGTLLWRTVLHWTSYVAISFFVGLMLTWMLNPFAPTGRLLANFLRVYGPWMLFAAILIPVFAMDTIRLTHRIAGPMVQIRRELQRLSHGQSASRVAFRPTDFWHVIAEEFNQMCDVAEPLLATIEPADEPVLAS